MATLPLSAVYLGNHDFDFGYPHLSNLLQDCKFVRIVLHFYYNVEHSSRSRFQPWLLSNIVDSDTGKVPAHLKEFEVFERAGVRIGVIGLVEKFAFCLDSIQLDLMNNVRDWIETVSAWPPNFKWKSMDDVGVDLSKTLRDPSGDHKCDIVVALTHSRSVQSPASLYLLLTPHYRVPNVRSFPSSQSTME